MEKKARKDESKKIEKGWQRKKMKGKKSETGRNPGKKLILSALLIVSLLVAGCSLTGNAVEEISKENEKENSPVREVKVKAFLFGYDPDVIYAKKGEKIKITVDNTDFPHGIRIPEFGARGADQVEFVAEKAGEFAWYCNAYCGDGHRKMSGKIVVSEK